MQNNGGQGSPIVLLDNYGCGNERVQLAISSYLDGEASPLECALAEEHLAECRRCSLMLASWSQGSGRLRQAALEPELDRIARSIASQTRAWLSQELAPRPTPAGRRVRKDSPSRLALSGIMTGLALFVSALGLGLSALLAVPAGTPYPAMATTASSVTLGVSNPSGGRQAQELYPPATPSLVHLQLSRPETRPVQPPEQYLNSQPPALSPYPLYWNSTPAAGQLTKPAGPGRG